MKIGLVYTCVTPELVELVESEVKKYLPQDTELMSYNDPSILSEAVEQNYVTANPAARLVTMYMKAVQDGADAILNICSSVGEVADACQDLAKYIGVPIVRIDEEMCREAVKRGKRIAIMATLQSTLVPTKNTVARVVREMNKRVEFVDVLVEGGFGLDQEQFKKLMGEYAEKVVDKVDVILLAQGSMAYSEPYLQEKFNKIFLSSPRFGAVALKEALVKKGLLNK